MSAMIWWILFTDEAVVLRVSVFDAHAEIKQNASYITIRHGGRGAVREVVELIFEIAEPLAGDACIV